MSKLPILLEMEPEKWLGTKFQCWHLLTPYRKPH